MGETTIEWTTNERGSPGYTFNPWVGCTKVHDGCTHCYAEVSPLVKFRGLKWGPGATRTVTGPDNWKKVLAWARAAARAGERRRVFCASLADVLDEEAPPEAQARLWNLIRVTARRCACGTSMYGEEDHRDHREPLPAGGLDWLLLSKRPQRWKLIPEDVRPLVWLGTSISDQKTADEWVPRLMAAEGFRIRFLSVEPLLGPVDLSQAVPYCHACNMPEAEVLTWPCATCKGRRFLWPDWIIIGGESGTKARPCDVAWVRRLVEQCQADSVPVFVKQLGSVPVMDEAAWRGRPFLLKANKAAKAPAGTVPLFVSDRKGGEMAIWPEDLRVRQLPEVARG